MIKIITLLLLMVAGSYGQWITKTTVPESIGTATTSGSACTLNTLIGKVTTDQATGNETTTITVNSNLFTANSVIFVSVYISEAINDAMVFISNIDTDNHFFSIRVSLLPGGTFSAEPVIFFQIIN